MGGISVWQLGIIAIIVVLLFGTKKLRNIGGDLGSAIKGFKGAMSDENQDNKAEKSSEALADSASSTTSDKSKAKEDSQA